MNIPVSDDFVGCCGLLAIAKQHASDVVDKNLVVAGYANEVAFLEFFEPYPVDRLVRAVSLSLCLFLLQ